MKKLILSSSLLLLLASCGKSPSELNAEAAKKANLYYPTLYTNGEILLPDYAHNDTLIVINAKKLNQLFSGNDVGSDEDISDILYEGAIPINKNQNQ